MYGFLYNFFCQKSILPLQGIRLRSHQSGIGGFSPAGGKKLLGAISFFSLCGAEASDSEKSASLFGLETAIGVSDKLGIGGFSPAMQNVLVDTLLFFSLFGAEASDSEKMVFPFKLFGAEAADSEKGVEGTASDSSFLNSFQRLKSGLSEYPHSDLRVL